MYKDFTFNVYHILTSLAFLNKPSEDQLDSNLNHWTANMTIISNHLMAPWY